MHAAIQSAPPVVPPPPAVNAEGEGPRRKSKPPKAPPAPPPAPPICPVPADLPAEAVAVLTVPVAALSAALETAALAVERKTKMPILLHALLTVADGGRTTLRATDLDTTIAVDLPQATAHRPGRVLLPLAEARATLRGLDKSGALALYAVPVAETENDPAGWAVHFRQGPARALLKTHSIPDDFPTATGFTGTTRPLPVADFADAFRVALAAAADNDPRVYLNGLCWEATEGGTVLVATDGHTLFVSREVPPLSPGQQVIIPRKPATIALRLLKGQESVQVGADAGFFRFACGGVTLTARRTEARFPDWRMVVPKPEAVAGKAATIPAVEFRDALARVRRSLAGHDGMQVAVLTCEGATLAMEGLSSEDSIKGLCLPVAGIEGAFPGPLGFNAAFLARAMDALAPKPGDKFTLAVASPTGPTLIERVGDPRLSLVVMPLDLSSWSY